MQLIVKKKNKSSNSGDWSWKESESPKQPFKAPSFANKNASRSERRAEKKKRKKEKLRQRKFSSKDAGDFFSNQEWLRLRYRVLKKYGGACMLCGRTYKENAVKIHVDHIKPRSKFPELELVFENLQVLCEDCNIGKSNLDQTDWRPSRVLDAEAVLSKMELQEIEVLSEARNRI